MNEYVLSVNGGSSSLKFRLYRMPDESQLLSGQFDGMNSANPVFKAVYGECKQQENLSTEDFGSAAHYLLSFMLEKQLIPNQQSLKVVGHRVAHGGEHYSGPVVIDNEVLGNIDRLSSLAPIHNPINLLCIQVFRQILPTAVHVAVFDTAFHQTIEPSRYLYPLPYEMYLNHKIRRYGFHGISHQYVSTVLSATLQEQSQKVINCHLGNGASICAMFEGRSVMTSMGFTPLAGLMMGTRCGDIDPALPIHIARITGTDLDNVDRMMNFDSGLLGVSQYSSDFRLINEAAQQGNQQAILAQEMFINRIVETVGAYAAALNGLDVLVFTGGIGENSEVVRQRVCEQLAYLGVIIETTKNHSAEQDISAQTSRIIVKIIKTDEELMIARESVKLLTDLVDSGGVELNHDD